MIDKAKLGFQTKAAHMHLDGKKENRPLAHPIFQGTNFQASSSEELGTLFKSRAPRFYTRFGNLNLKAAGEKIAEFEGADAGLVFSSGMGAITTSLLAVLRAGDHVVAQRNIFAQTFLFLDEMARRYGVETTFVDATQPGNIAAALQPQTKLIYIETPSNPQLKVVDIAAIAAVARRHGALLYADNTFASPYLQNPVALGASLALHSATKYLGGHSDLLCGAVAGHAEVVERIRQAQEILGNVMDPHAAWLLLRSLKTLGLRVQRQSDNAAQVAGFLAGKPGIRQVAYPWLRNSPGYEIARKQMRGGGGMVSFEVEGGLPAARAFVNAVELIPIASSLGGSETIIEIPCELDFCEQELGADAALTGIDAGLIRLSVGTEDVQDLTADLEKGLAALQEHLASHRAAVAG